MSDVFIMDHRLGIPLPHLNKNWEQYTKEEQAAMLLSWEEIRGTIPEQIKRLEIQIIGKQEQLNIEDDFSLSCLLNSEIAELAGTINELHLWFRVNQDITDSRTHQ